LSWGGTEPVDSTSAPSSPTATRSGDLGVGTWTRRHPHRIRRGHRTDSAGDRGGTISTGIRLARRRALDIEPNNPNYLDSLGWAYYRRGDYDEAEKYATPAAQQMPRNATVQEHMGDILAKRGRWADAIAAWTRALQGDEGDVNKAAVEKKIADARGKVR